MLAIIAKYIGVAVDAFKLLVQWIKSPSGQIAMNYLQIGIKFVKQVEITAPAGASGKDKFTLAYNLLVKYFQDNRIQIPEASILNKIVELSHGVYSS